MTQTLESAVDIDLNDTEAFVTGDPTSCGRGCARRPRSTGTPHPRADSGP